MTNLAQDIGSTRCLWHVHEEVTERAKRFPTTWSHPRLPFLLMGFGWVVKVMKEKKKHRPELLVGNMDSSGVDAPGRMRSLSTVVLERLASFFTI